MKILQINDKDNKDYVPTYQELGLDEETFDSLTRDQKGSDYYAKLTDEWMAQNAIRIDTERDKLKLKSAQKERSLELHWYNTLDSESLLDAIEKTRDKADLFIDEIIKSQTKNSFINYYDKLRHSVKFGEIRLNNADSKKLKKFPKYDRGRKEIFGSRYSIVTLWSHVFSLRNK